MLSQFTQIFYFTNARGVVIYDLIRDRQFLSFAGNTTMHQETLLSRLLSPVRTALSRLRGPAVPRPIRAARRARLQVEALEAKVVPSAAPVLSAPVLDAHTVVHTHPSHLNQYNGIYNVTYQAIVTLPDGSKMPEQGAFPIRITNGVIAALGAKNSGSVAPNGALNIHGKLQGVSFTLKGHVTLGSHGSAHASGTFSGSFLGNSVVGNWQATKH
jgi:hypothetical protein